MAEYKIKLGTELDLKGINTAVKSYKGNPIEFKSKLDTTGIKNALTNYKAKPIEIGAKLNAKGISEKIKSLKPKTPIEVNAKLNTKNINAAINGYQPKDININANLTFKGVAGKISEYSKSAKPIRLNAELNKSAINNAVNEFNGLINAAESKTRIKIKAEPVFDGIDQKIVNYTPRALMKINAKINKSQIDKSIQDFKTGATLKISNVALSENAVKKALTLYNPDSPVPVKVDFILGDTNKVDAKIQSYKKDDVFITAKLMPSDKGFTTNITKKPVEVKAKLNPDGINSVIEKFKTSNKINVGIKLDPKDIGGQIKQIAKPTESIEVGVRLDGKKINEDIALFLPTATLGVKPDLIVEDMDEQIAAYVPKTKLKVNIGINEESIKSELKKGKNGQSPITVNVELDREKLNEQIRTFKSNSLLTVGVKFDKQKVEEKIRSYKPKSLMKIGVEVDPDDIAKQVGNVDNNTPIRLGVELDPKGIKNVQDQVDALRQQIKALGNVTINLNSGTGAYGGSTGGKDKTTIATQNLKEASIQIDDLENHIGSLKKALNTIGFDGAAIDNITKDFEELDIVVKNVATRLDKKGNLSLTIKGVDQMQRAVTVMKQINKDGTTTNLGTSVSQSFKETENAYKRLKTVASEMSKLKVKITGLDPNKDKQQIAELASQLKGLQTEYHDLYTITRQNLDTSQLDALKQKSIETANAVKIAKAAMADKVAYDKEQAEIRETRDEYQKLIKVANSMQRIKVTLAGLDAEKDAQRIAELTAQAKVLKREYIGLYNANKGNFDTNQIDALNQKHLETAKAVRVARAAMADKAVYDREQQEIRETRDEYQKLIKIANSMQRIKVTLAGLDPKTDKNRIAELNRQLNGLEKEYNDLHDASQKSFNTQQLDGLKQKAAETEKAVKDVKAAMADVNANKASSIRSNFSGYDATIEKLKLSMETLSMKPADVKTGIENVEKALAEMRKAADDKSLIEAEERYQTELKETLALLSKQHSLEDTDLYGDTFEVKKESALERLKGLFEPGSQAAKRFGAEAQKLRNELEAVGNVKGVDNVNRKIGALEKQIKSANVQTKTWSTRLREQFSKYSSYLSIASVFMYATRAARSMFEQVKLIDSAMTELKKVTDETDATYNKFLDNAASRAKELGTTIDGLISSTADFARLGYGFEEAQGLAEVANIYAVVGDEIEGVEGATESLISTLAAFKEQAGGMSDTDFAMNIIDIYNELGNKFAISSGGLGAALERSASSLAAANNTLEQSAALITAANEVVQNPEKVGTAFKTISMRMKIHCPH